MNTKLIALSLALILAAPALHAADDARTTGLEEAFADLAVDAAEEVATLEPAEQRLVKCTKIVLDALSAKRKLTLPNLRRVFINFRDALECFAAVKPLPAIPRTTTTPLLRQANALWSSVYQAPRFDLFDDSVLDKMKEGMVRALASGIESPKDCSALLLMQVTHALITDAFNKAYAGSLARADLALLKTAITPIMVLHDDIHPPVQPTASDDIIFVMTPWGPVAILPGNFIIRL